MKGWMGLVVCAVVGSTACSAASSDAATSPTAQEPNAPNVSAAVERTSVPTAPVETSTIRTETTTPTDTDPSRSCGRTLTADDPLASICGQRATAVPSRNADIGLGLSLAAYGYPFVRGEPFTAVDGAPVTVGYVCSSKSRCEGFFVGGPQSPRGDVVITDVIDLKTIPESAVDWNSQRCSTDAGRVVIWFDDPNLPVEYEVVLAFAVASGILRQVPTTAVTCAMTNGDSTGSRHETRRLRPAQ